MGWSCSDSDSGSVSELEVGNEPPALEGAVVVVTLEGGVEGAARGLAGKRKREDELTQQPARHSLWEQDSLEACNEWLFGYLDGEVEVLQQRKAVYDEERRLSDGSDSCWSGAGSDSDSEAELVVGSRSPALEGAVVVVTLGAARGLAGKRKREDELTQQPARHSLWEQDSLVACNEWLFGCLDVEVGALQQRKAVYDEARRLSDGSDSCWSCSGSDSGNEAELEVGSEPLTMEGAHTTS